MLISSGSTAGLGPNYNTCCTSLLPMISQNFSFLNSVVPGRRLPEVGMGTICIRHSIGSRGHGGLGS